MGESLDIAIIGMEGLFAKAPTIDRFWSNILNKVDAVTDASDEWLGEPRLLDPEAPPEKLRLYTRRGGFLGDLSRFDPRPHGTMPISVLGGEADQFLALDCASKVLDNSGYGTDRDYDRSRVGCILGHAIHANRGNVNGFGHALVIDQVLNGLGAVMPGMTEDQREAAEEILRSQLPKFSVDTLPALVPNMMTGRICNRLNLMGPNYILDGACASTSIALLAAADELRLGRADMMLAGGVNTTSSTLVYGVFCQLGALSRSAKVKPFSSDADGTLLGEGQGIFLLKRLDDALKADDNVIAVIRGIGISSDGRSSGLMAPWQKGEALAIQRAYEQSGTDPNTIDLLEAHGTGIPLGDRTEIDALREVFGERTKPAPHIALGSVKSMIGHCIPAAGAASLAKVCKAIGEGILPPTLVDEQNPELGLESTAFYLNREARPWLRRKDQPRRAGIDSFGFGGINSHILVEESPQALQADLPAFGLRRQPQPELFVLAAHDRSAMLETITNIRAQIASADDLASLADEAARIVKAGACRLGLLATSLADLDKKLGTASDRLIALEGNGFALTKPGIFYNEAALAGKTVFMFPGEMSQYPHMLSDLAMASPSTTAWLSRLEGLYGDDRERPHRHLLFGPRDAVAREEAEVTDRTLERVEEGSEAVFFADMAYFRLLDQLGVKADMMIGHSTGENAALIASRTIGFDDEGVSDFIRQMNVIFSEIDRSGAVPEGALLNVGAAPDGAIDAALETHADLRLTMDNCPNQTILFGPESAIKAATEELSAKGAVCQPLPLAWAYHTEHIAPLADRFHELFAAAPLGDRHTVLYSCSTAEPYPLTKEEAIEIAARQYKTRVRFTDAVRRLYEDGARVFIEVGASSSLSGFVRDTLAGHDEHVVSCDNRRRSSAESFLKAIGQLFALGVFTDTASLVRGSAETDAHETLPPLPSHLPLVRLSSDKEEKLRAVLEGAKPAPHVVETKPEPEAVEPVRTAPSTGQPLQVTTLPITKAWRFPDAVQVVLARFEGEGFVSPQAVALSPQERERFAAEAEGKAELKKREWLAARAAGKAAIGALFAVEPQSTETVKFADGRTAGEAGDRSCTLSLSHKDGIAVAAAAHTTVGIDIERVVRLRDAHGMEQRVLTDAERLYLARCSDRVASFFMLWTMKEAAAKALGTGFVGQEAAFEVEAVNDLGQEGIVAFQGRRATAYARRRGDYWVTLAMEGVVR